MYTNTNIQNNGLINPISQQETTQKIFPKTDFFGLEPEENLVSPLKTLEEEDPEASLLVLSDVNLDLPSVWMKLQKLLDGYADDPPVAIILFGRWGGGGGESEKGNEKKNIFERFFVLFIYSSLP